MNENTYVGILLNAPVYKRLRRGRSTGHEKMRFYEEAAEALGLTPCYLQLSSLAPGGSRGKTKALVRSAKGYASVTLNTPGLIHNRAIYRDRRSTRRLENFTRTGGSIFNLHTRYDKLMLHRLLVQDPLIRPHLPETEAAAPQTLRSFMERYPALIIKPANGSVGQGIMLLRRRDSGGWSWKRRPSRRHKWQITRFAGSLPPPLVRRMRQRKYVVQQFLSLARFGESPFDIRVSVQRNETGEWQITGMVAKVARKGAFLTNVAQGGSVAPLEVIFQSHPDWDPVDLVERISGLSLHIARFMSAHLEGLADLGLDMGIMEDGHIIFIEANGRDQRYSFGEAGMMEEWRATYRNPMAYASFLSKAGKKP